MGAPQEQQEEAKPQTADNGRETLQIWRSRMGWRVVWMVFAVVFLIQATVFSAAMRNYETEQLRGLREVARVSLIPVIENTSEQLRSPLSKQAAEKLFAHTIIQGLRIYGLDYTLIQSYGQPMVLQPDVQRRVQDSYLSRDRQHLEVVFASNDIGHPYNVIARLDASDVAHDIDRHTRLAFLIIALLSAFITGILMMAMNQLLLEPLLRRSGDMLQEAQSQAEDKIRKLAYFDTLTGLPNRTYFLEHLEESIEDKNQGRSNDILAVFSVDIDHFKDINDAMGHEVGDKLLEVVSRRLVQCMPDEAVVARSSADEFAVMAFLSKEQQDSLQLAEKIFASIAEPMEIMREKFMIKASIGVSIYPDDGKDAREILKNADIALNRAKTEGRSTVRHYSRDFDLMVQQRAQMLRDLRTAMEKQELLLHYHPQFDLRTGEIVGAEALLRWWKPDANKEGGKFISPAEFIPVAEQSGLIVPIGEYVLRTACATAKSWQDKGLPPFRVAVNISGIQFHRSDIVALVSQVLEETKLEPQWLELELTESIFIEDAQTAIDIMYQLHDLGVQLAVDDFGTGYSSLSYLRQFPIDRLKIDQSFVRMSLVNINDRMITRAIITLGRSLGLKIIAEGVETKDHEDLLREEGCDETQGFKYTKPIPADKLWDFVVNYNETLSKSKKTYMVE